MKRPAHFTATFALMISAALLLPGCGGKSIFVDKDDVPLEGERISVLQLQKELSPDPALQNVAVTLPDPWANQFWPQRGGYPGHAMGHLSLGPELKEAWTADIGAGGNRREPLISAPVVAEGMVFALDSEGEVSAFDLATGKNKWRASSIPRGEDDEGGAVGGGIAYAAGRLFATNGYKQVVAMDPATGAVTWKAALPAPARAAPVVADDRVYVTTLDNRLMVFAAPDGTPLWNHQGVAQDTNLLGSASPAADETVVVLPLSSGELLGLRPENGRVVWGDNLSAVRRMGALSSITDIRGLPVIDRGMVFAVSYSGRFVALDQVSGRRLWQRETGSAETPWPAGEFVFTITTEQQLAALARTSGGIRWNIQLPRYEGESKDKPIVWAGPIVAGGRLIVAGSHGALVEVDPADGKILREMRLKGHVSVPPVVAANTLLVLTENGTLAAYR